MIKIQSKMEETEISFYDEKIWLTNQDFQRLKENLFIEFNEGKNRIRTQVKLEELNFQQFNCLVYKHQAIFADKTFKTLDVRHIHDSGIKYFSIVDSYKENSKNKFPK